MRHLIRIIAAVLAIGAIAQPSLVRASDLTLPPDLAKALAPKAIPTAPASIIPATVAQETTPAPPVAPPPNPDLAMTLKNPKFDPCGGYQELLMKYLIGTPCTYKTGQGIVAGQYLAVYAPTNTLLLLNGQSSTLTTNANIHIYPRLETLVGIGNRMMLSYYPPTFQEVLVNGVQQNAGTADQQLYWKQEMYFNPKGNFLGGLQLGYIWPSGSEAFNGAGPAYKVNPIVMFPIGYLLALNINFAFLDKPFTVSDSPNPVRRVAFAPTVGATWRSPGATMENLVVAYNSVAGQFSLINVLTQQVGRHVGITLGYAYNRSSTAEDLNDIISLDNTTHVYALSFGLTYQWGESEVFNAPGAPKPNRCKMKQPTC